MSDIFEGRVILVTGGTGSFGLKFTETLLKKHNPRSVRIYSRGELKQVDMERRFDDDRLRFLIGDIRDRERLYRALNDVDIVVHAAALKHVPVCEYNPAEAAKTNIMGAMNLINGAIDNGVDKVVALSTDKAVHPVNLYGATKMVMEKLIIQGNVYAGRKGTKFSCTRYGNVIGSSGSVVPVFIQQKESGKITITDERMTRFWITLEQGIDFVTDSLKMMKGGEIFVPKIPSMKITDLADAITPNAKKRIIGIRPGEKLHEVLLTADEARHAKEFSSYFIIEPEYKFWRWVPHAGGKSLPGGFAYTSNNNTQWLEKEELRKMLVKQGFL